MVTNVFVDTNVLPGYLLIHGKDRITRNKEDKQKLWKQYQGLVSSFKLISEILKSKDRNFKFIISPLTFSEIFNVLYEEAICKKMWDDGVPLSSWIRKKKSFKFLEDFEIKELEKDAFKLYSKNNLKIVNEFYDLKLIPKLILKYNLMTQDAILFSTANKYCKFFISRDEDFIKNPRLREDFKKIEIISPEEALRKFFKK